MDFVILNDNKMYFNMFISVPTLNKKTQVRRTRCLITNTSRIPSLPQFLTLKSVAKDGKY